MYKATAETIKRIGMEAAVAASLTLTSTSTEASRADQLRKELTDRVNDLSLREAFEVYKLVAPETALARKSLRAARILGRKVLRKAIKDKVCQSRV